MIDATIGIQRFNFPKGETQISISVSEAISVVHVYFEFESMAEIFDLALLVDAVKNGGKELGVLTMPYVPFGRQDRVANPGENFSLRVFCDFINGLGFEKVVIVDPHSDVTTALLERVVVCEQHEVFADYFDGFVPEFYLVCPDAGAYKKIRKLAARTNPYGVIECSKVRDTKTGKILSTVVHATDLGGRECFIVDDICDGGFTFTEIAKELRRLNAGQITLMVTHGFFTKGLDVFDGLIDQIITHKGIVK